MSLKVFDYNCIKCRILKEYFVTEFEENNIRCANCSEMLVKEMPNPRGKVVGTRNPVRQ